MTYPVTTASTQSMLSRATENQELGRIIQELLRNSEMDFTFQHIYPIANVEKKLENIIDLLNRANKNDSKIINELRTFKYTSYLYNQRSKPAMLRAQFLSAVISKFDREKFYRDIVNYLQKIKI
tara:strand:- start:265 stop:636 length:372 start_codon:yes stop_codon:yes gene_type:complete